MPSGQTLRDLARFPSRLPPVETSFYSRSAFPDSRKFRVPRRFLDSSKRLARSQTNHDEYPRRCAWTSSSRKRWIKQEKGSLPRNYVPKPTSAHYELISQGDDLGIEVKGVLVDRTWIGIRNLNEKGPERSRAYRGKAVHGLPSRQASLTKSEQSHCCC